MKYADLTPPMLGMLRVYSAVERIYPGSGDRATRTLAGYAQWRTRQAEKASPKHRSVLA